MEIFTISSVRQKSKNRYWVEIDKEYHYLNTLGMKDNALSRPRKFEYLKMIVGRDVYPFFIKDKDTSSFPHKLLLKRLSNKAPKVNASYLVF